MIERATTAYARLFEVRILHHYWLDDGAKVFDALPKDQQAERLAAYDVRTILGVTPTPSTRKRLAGLRCAFVPTAQGFVVAAPGGLAIAADTEFAFSVTVADGRLFDYTALTLRPQAIHEASDPADHSPGRAIYRYKENVPLLSNLTGATRGTGADTILFLSRDYPAPSASDQVEALVQSGGALLQLTSDNPSATSRQLGADVAKQPIYVHQGDAPVIVPPADVTGAPARGMALSGDTRDDVFALIKLVASRGDNGAFSFVGPDGLARVPAPVYHVRFKNRSTLWAYLDKQTGAVKSTSPGPLPLTWYGNADGTGQKPSRGGIKAESSGARITQLVSEIYI
jgi:hypothetical protein